MNWIVGVILQPILEFLWEKVAGLIGLLFKRKKQNEVIDASVNDAKKHYDAVMADPNSTFEQKMKAHENLINAAGSGKS